MKFHRPIAEQVLSALQQTFGDGYHADKVIERLFKNNRQLGSRDRRFIAETVYECVRWWRFLWVSLGRTEPSLEKADLWHLLGAWLILRGPSSDGSTSARQSGLVSNATTGPGPRTGSSAPSQGPIPLPPLPSGLPNWPEFRALDADEIRARAQEARKIAAVRESVPDWLYEQGRRELGDVWDGFLSELNKQAPVVLRANRLKGDRETLARRLAADEIETFPAPETNDGLVLKERRNVFTTEAFKEGLFEVQDGASQQVAPLLAIEPGMRVIDACAGAGGKTLHIAALLRNKGKIIAMDVHARKLEELRKRCTRAGVDVAETRLIESAKTTKRLEKSADRLLLDVPCSGMGVLRRNPDSKWKLHPEEMERLRALQAEILATYSEMVKPGGRMVYATCSCLPSENEKQVEAFLASRSETWRLVEEKRFAPGTNGYDGFYAAALERI